MHDVLAHMTHYYTRYYGSTEGEQSSQWLHDHIAKVRLWAMVNFLVITRLPCS